VLYNQVETGAPVTARKAPAAKKTAARGAEVASGTGRLVSGPVLGGWAGLTGGLLETLSGGAESYGR
jgi:hypothetical protein